MSVASAPYYWLVCDGCGVKSTEDSDYSAWADLSFVHDDAEESGWIVAARIWLLNADHPVDAVLMDLCHKCRPLIGDDDEWVWAMFERGDERDLNPAES